MRGALGLVLGVGGRGGRESSQLGVPVCPAILRACTDGAMAASPQLLGCSSVGSFVLAKDPALSAVCLELGPRLPGGLRTGGDPLYPAPASPPPTALQVELALP